MEAPDKVFFPNDINLLTKLSLVLKQEGDVCYIRKDAVLEWAKKELNKCVGNSSWQRFNTFQEIINKLNSM